MTISRSLFFVALTFLWPFWANAEAQNVDSSPTGVEQQVLSLNFTNNAEHSTARVGQQMEITLGIIGLRQYGEPQVSSNGIRLGAKAAPSPLAGNETDFSPKLILPPDQADFAIFHPSIFRWEPSPGAVSYLLEWENYPNAVDLPVLLKVQGTEFKYETVGLTVNGLRSDLTGHWRVWPVDATGTRGTPSEWRTLHYLSPQTPDDPELAPPKLVSPPDRAVFDVYPRHAALEWEPSPGADSYVVETDYRYNGVWIAEAHKNPSGFLVQDTQFSFNFVGAQPGRWRVWPVNAKDQRGTPSEWRTFRYLR